VENKVNLVNINLEDIYPNPNNPRQSFEAMDELVASVRQVGVLQPVLVVWDAKSNKYRLVAGERRYRAAKEVGLKWISAVVRELDANEELQIMIIENLQRQDVNPIEEAQGLRTLLDTGITQEKLAEKLGCSQAHIANRLRLLRLPDKVKENISRKIISAGHAHNLLKLEKTPSIMEKAANVIAEEKVPVAKSAEHIAKVISEEGKPLFNHYRNKPEFKTKQCGKCEFRVMGKPWLFADEESPYCIKPSCWEKKQREARQKREEALLSKVQKEAKKDQGVISLDKFDWDQYEEFRDYKINDMDLTECETCKHKKVAKNSYRDELIEACFQPACFKKKKMATIREKNKKAREQFKKEVNQIGIMAGLKAASMVKKSSDNNFKANVTFDKPTLIFIAAVILSDSSTAYDRNITLFRYLRDKFGWENDLFKNSTWGIIGKEWWATFRGMLETLSEEELIEIIFEWPAVARGMDGATGWILQQNPGEIQSQESIYLDDQGHEIVIDTGIGDKKYGAFRRKANGSLQRLKNIPMDESKENVQANLREWAEKKGFSKVHTPEVI